MQSKLTMVLISGKAGVGKTTLANILKGKLDNCIISSFATPLKYMAILMGWDKNKDSRGRTLLQDLGRIGRNYDENVWVRLCMEDSLRRAGDNEHEFVVVDDWRFPNELDYIKNLPGVDVISVHISAPNREILLGTPEYNDISETSLTDDPAKYDLWVDNTENMSKLNIESDRVVKYILDHTTKW